MKNNFYNEILKYKKNINICDETKSYLRKYIKTNRNNINLFLAKSINFSYFNKPEIEYKLVIWGINLTSTVGYGRFTKQIRNMITLPYFQQSILIGILLSDGYL
jgi:CRISPR/Cas system CSM-associated protein Csm4 (group 5 of RAMP superfamily)